MDDTLVFGIVGYSRERYKRLVVAFSGIVNPPHEGYPGNFTYVIREVNGLHQDLASDLQKLHRRFDGEVILPHRFIYRPTIRPANAMAGQTSNLLFNFSTFNPLPIDAQIKFKFPPYGFDATNVSRVVFASGIDGSFALDYNQSVTGGSFVALRRRGDGTVIPGEDQRIFVGLLRLSLIHI